MFLYISFGNFHKTKYNVDRGAFDISNPWHKRAVCHRQQRMKGENAEASEQTIPKAGRKVNSLATVTWKHVLCYRMKEYRFRGVNGFFTADSVFGVFCCESRKLTFSSEGRFTLL